MLSAGELRRVVDSAKSSIFRLEALAAYDVTAQQGYLDAYLAGEPLDLSRRRRWLDTLRARADRGIVQRHLRVLREPLSDYDRMACEWGYAPNVDAGLDVRVLPVTGKEIWRDFYLLDDRTAVLMRYDDDGRFIDAEVDPVIPIRPHTDVVADMWAAGEPFAGWWAGHPEYHRQVLAG